MAESKLDPDSWQGKCVHSESTLHQLSPFLGKMKSSMANELIRTYSDPQETILDPFSGSGTIPLEAAITHRHAIGIDRNQYALTLSKGKLNPPNKLAQAKSTATQYLSKIEPEEKSATRDTPDWVQKFFHPKTLSGLEQLFPLLRENNEKFLLACLLGILHHQRPGFLSYPASHLKPYLKKEKFPKDEHPDRYEYREIEPRLIAKIERAYRRFPTFDHSLRRQILTGDAPSIMKGSIGEGEVNTIITSPPYMNKLDYGRDNRLRLYFLGVEDYQELDTGAESKQEYREFLDGFLTQALRVLNVQGRLIFVLGESRRSGALVDTSEVVMEMVQSGEYQLSIEDVIQDQVPVREINSMSSNQETILVTTTY